MTIRFIVRIYRYGGDYSAMVPDLPGCVAAADTVEAVRKLMAEAITLHLELMLEAGQRIPPPRQSVKFAIDKATEEEFCTWVDAKPPRGAKIRGAPGKKVGA